MLKKRAVMVMVGFMVASIAFVAYCAVSYAQAQPNPDAMPCINGQGYIYGYVIVKGHNTYTRTYAAKKDTSNNYAEITLKFSTLDGTGMTAYCYDYVDESIKSKQVYFTSVEGPERLTKNAQYNETAQPGDTYYGMIANTGYPRYDVSVYYYITP